MQIQLSEQLLSNEPSSSWAAQRVVKRWLQAWASSVSLLLLCLMFQKMSDSHCQAPNLHHPGQKQTQFRSEVTTWSSCILCCHLSHYLSYQPLTVSWHIYHYEMDTYILLHCQNPVYPYWIIFVMRWWKVQCKQKPKKKSLGQKASYTKKSTANSSKNEFLYEYPLFSEIKLNIVNFHLQMTKFILSAKGRESKVNLASKNRAKQNEYNVSL